MLVFGGLICVVFGVVLELESFINDFKGGGK